MWFLLFFYFIFLSFSALCGSTPLTLFSQSSFLCFCVVFCCVVFDCLTTIPPSYVVPTTSCRFEFRSVRLYIYKTTHGHTVWVGALLHSYSRGGHNTYVYIIDLFWNYKSSRLTLDDTKKDARKTGTPKTMRRENRDGQTIIKSR